MRNMSYATMLLFDTMENASNSGPRPVRAVTRAFALIEELARHPDGARLSDLAAACGLNPSTTHNLLATLEHLGYTTQVTAAGCYRLTDQFEELSRAVSRDDTVLKERMHPTLASLARDTGETCYLAIASWQAAVYLDAVESPHPLRVGAAVGEHDSLLSTAIGQVLLAYRPATARRLEAIDPDGWTRWSGAITAARRDGYALDIEQNTPGLCCVAVSVPDNGVARAALCLAGPADRLPAPRLRELAHEMKNRVSTVEIESV